MDRHNADIGGAKPYAVFLLRRARSCAFGNMYCCFNSGGTYIYPNDEAEIHSRRSHLYIGRHDIVAHASCGYRLQNSRDSLRICRDDS